ncbi:response regulator transcription factor [Yeosuana sp. MJ-SS3]|jgi:DNA-binding response OmpR family regulator|uniref:Response regulator transcription factor n=1 Tax=Gilvirhabdus luticola TaxID=3079858 RepID=A0ABU3U3S6_9FLAO|nr:response regulator transcription factor [Yeosuana sp. MJ-SS3]MDU8885062.1 response regulator transcription factor [Yeosuana sp. MJ-SS3]
METVENKIILVEDDDALGYLLSEYLSMNNFKVSWVKTGEECLKLLMVNTYNLCILDVMLPDIDGFNLAKEIKNKYPSLPFIFLTARSLKIDVLKGFSLGAIDYLKKPIDEEELVVRINNLLTRLNTSKPQKKESNIINVGDYTFNQKNQELIFNNEITSLTKKENELLLYLVKNKNSLCTHRDILVNIWGKNDYFNKKSLNVFITHLRKYLKNDSSIRIENVHNQGFILKVD